MFKAAHPEFVPYAGGTDLMVEAREGAKYLFLNDVPELKELYVEKGELHIGAGVTFTQALASPLVPELMKEAVRRIAAPAIRNAGTFGGNIGNGSAKADSVLIHYVADASVVLASVEGRRAVPIERFYQGRKKLDLAPDELIEKIVLPLDGLDNYYYHKVGGRRALAISRVAFAGVFATDGNPAGERITRCSTAFGAVAGTVLRYHGLEKMLVGATLEEARALHDEYLAAYDKRMQLTRGRVSAEYRKAVCLNLLDDFLKANGI
jgi:CO/xanthine dehydrogenase FAD-binding subunit